MATRPAGDVAAFCKKYPVLLPQTLLRNVQMFTRPVLLNIMWKTGGSVFINTTRNVHLSRQKLSWKMSRLNQVCCWKCSSSLSKISEYFTTNTAGKCLDVSSKTSSGFRLINVETLSEQRSLTIISPSTLKSSYKHVRLIRHVLQDYTCKTQLNFVFRTN